MASTTNHSRPLAKRVKIKDVEGSDETQVLVKSRTRNNWFHPHIWPAIDIAATQTNYSAREIVKYLQSRHQDTGLYNTLNSSTVDSWIDTKSTSMKRQWLPRVTESVCQATGWSPSRQHYRTILDGKDKLIEKIKETLLAIRQASLTVNANLARTIILGYIQAECPELIEEEASTSLRPRGKAPIFSLTTTKRFLYDHLNWSSRRATKDGQKTPLDWEDLCLATFFRFFYTVMKENIHPSMIINMDQTGVILVPGANDATYEKKGSKQVPIHGKDEKRAFTAVLSVSMSGHVLPIQSVWKGATGRSLPTNGASAEATAAGHRFVFNKDSHWSSFTTTQAWINDIVLPYRATMIEKHFLSPDAKMILYIDSWTVHRSKEFRNWIKEKHSGLIVLYVPAGCTGIFQPCDVGLQRLFKHNIKISASQFFVKTVQKDREEGIASSEIRLPTSLPELRNATPLWVSNGVEYLNTPIATDDGMLDSIGAKAWRNC